MTIEYKDSKRIVALEADRTGGSITLDAESNNHASASATSITISGFTVGNNSNKILIVSVGSYNPTPTVSGITWNSSENFTQINTVLNNGRADLWYLVNPTSTTADIVVTYSSSAGSRSAGVTSLYNVNQSTPIGVTNTVTGTGGTIAGTITPTTTGSWIIDSAMSLTGLGAITDTLTAGFSNLIGGVDRSHGTQYSASPTINSANSMTWTNGQSSYAWAGAEIKKAEGDITNVQDNSILVEKDTARRYWFSDEFSKSNCKAYFTLDETSGNPANHATTANGFSDGNGINGTNGSTGATQNITGKFDKCFEFSGGNNEQVDMGNTILSGTTDFTLSGWINSSITSSGTYVIFNSYLGSATAGIQLYVNGSGNIIYWTSTGSITTSTATSGSNNSWDHVVVTKEGTSVKIYLNGAVDVSGTINHSITGGNLSIGGRSDGLYCFKGKIDESSIWTRALSASEISELYNSGTGKTLLEAKTATWINEFGISDGLIFGGVTGSYADYSDSQSWNGVSWTAGGNLTGNRASGASAGTGSTSARYVNGYNASPAPYPNSNRNESYNGTAWTSDTSHPDTTNNKQNNGCGTADNMLVGNGHSNGTGDVNNWYKWTGSWTSVTASGLTGHDCSLSGTLTSAIQTKTTASKTWNGTAWTSVSATGVSRSLANSAGTNSSDAFRVMSTGSPPTIVSSELWNGTAWTASGNAVTAKSEAGSTHNFSNNMMVIGGQDPSAIQSLSTQEYRKGVFTTGSSISGSRRLSGASG